MLSHHDGVKGLAGRLGESEPKRRPPGAQRGHIRGKRPASDGSVHRHLREQDRQQGAGVRPRHLSRRPRRPVLRRHRRPAPAQIQRDPLRRHGLDGGARPQREPGRLLLGGAGRPDCDHLRRHQATAVRRRGPRHAAGLPDEPCAARRYRRLRRARAVFRDLGADGARNLQGRGPPTLAREGPHAAPAPGRAVMTTVDRTAGAAGGHRPVMLREVLEVLNPRAGGIYVDGTFGAGGYSRALLDAADCTVWGVDRDPDAIAAGAPLAQHYKGRLNLVTGRFGDMAALLTARGVDATDGVALDIGVSSMQLDRPERGFSFRADGPLDMRMEKQGESAADVVNGRSERELADIIHDYGEERRARAIARAIVAARRTGPITGTLQLAQIVRRTFGGKSAAGIDPATRTFQALRIYVNDELGE